MRFTITFLALIGFCLQIAGQHAVVYKVKNKLQVQKELPAGSTLLVPKNKKMIIHYYDMECDCFHVQYKEIRGIVLSENWLNDAFWYPIKKKNRADTALTEYAHRFLIENIAKLPVIKPVPEQESARRLKLIQEYGHTDGINIASGKLWLGMTAKMVLDSWGIPFQIKRTVSNFHISEQWIYSGAYLFLENGVLTEVFKFNQK